MEILVPAVQILLSFSSFILALVVAISTFSEKRKEPFTVTDLQSVADSPWVTYATRKAARQELRRRTDSMELRATISSLGKIEEEVIGKLRYNQPDITQLKKKFKEDDSLTSFTEEDAGISSLYIRTPLMLILCLACVGGAGWLVSNQCQKFTSDKGLDVLEAGVTTSIFLILIACIIFFAWRSLRNCKITHQYIQSIQSLVEKSYEVKDERSIAHARYRIGDWIKSHPKIDTWV